jgi:hypothetical protein
MEGSPGRPEAWRPEPSADRLGVDVIDPYHALEFGERRQIADNLIDKGQPHASEEQLDPTIIDKPRVDVWAKPRRTLLRSERGPVRVVHPTQGSIRQANLLLGVPENSLARPSVGSPGGSNRSADLSLMTQELPGHGFTPDSRVWPLQNAV